MALRVKSTYNLFRLHWRNLHDERPGESTSEYAARGHDYYHILMRGMSSSERVVFRRRLRHSQRCGLWNLFRRQWVVQHKREVNEDAYEYFDRIGAAYSEVTTQLTRRELLALKGRLAACEALGLVGDDL